MALKILVSLKMICLLMNHLMKEKINNYSESLFCFSLIIYIFSFGIHVISIWCEIANPNPAYCVLMFSTYTFILIENFHPLQLYDYLIVFEARTRHPMFGILSTRHIHIVYWYADILDEFCGSHSPLCPHFCVI